MGGYDTQGSDTTIGSGCDICGYGLRATYIPVVCGICDTLTLDGESSCADENNIFRFSICRSGTPAPALADAVGWFIYWLADSCRCGGYSGIGALPEGESGDVYVEKSFDFALVFVPLHRRSAAAEYSVAVNFGKLGSNF